MTAVQVDRDDGGFRVIDADTRGDEFVGPLAAGTCGRHRDAHCLDLDLMPHGLLNEKASQPKLHTLLSLHIISALPPEQRAYEFSRKIWI
jgi:hypothetical protein